MNPIQEEIQQLKKEKNAVILAHYYVPCEVQQIADYIGDSFYLSKIAAQIPQDVLVFCGVSFMGEGAKILNPQKTVLMPDAEADCPMAHMVDLTEVERLKQAIEDLAVVCYVNSTALIKAHSDVCVTSANALKIVQALPHQNILFIPDENLGRYIAAQLPEKQFYYSGGYCPVHGQITAEDVLEAKAAHPQAPVLMHPECRPEALALADYAGSTSGILKYAAEHSAQAFIIGTEEGIFCKLREQNPNKAFFPIGQGQCCTDMKRITLEKVRQVLQTGANAVEADETLRLRSNRPLNRMLELAR